MLRRPLCTALLLIITPALAACDLLGLPDPKQIEADGKATGAACRQAGRALSDCYQLNPTLSKAAIFQGWREMNDYMTEQKLEVVQPQLVAPLPRGVSLAQAAQSEASAEPAQPEAAADAAASPPAKEAAKRKTKAATADKAGQAH